jgi:hydrogenase maturation protein HypF
LNRAVLSGGVFQNVIFLTGLKRALEDKGFEVFSHSLVPTNDGGISLGQAVIAAANTEG